MRVVACFVFVVGSYLYVVVCVLLNVCCSVFVVGCGSSCVVRCVLFLVLLYVMSLLFDWCLSVVVCCVLLGVC